MNKFLAICKRCLNPWVIGILIVAAIGLIIFVPIIGAASVVVLLPLIGCTVMCGAMVFMNRQKDK